MFGTIRALILGANARAEEQVRDIYSIELIEQKIREAQSGLKAAKVSLAGLIQRQRREADHVIKLEGRVIDMEMRVRDALKAEKDALAKEGATAIAQMENELTMRRETLRKLETRVMRLDSSVEKAHRRMEDLKQGAIAARALRREQEMQVRLGHSGDGMGGAMEEAESLIGRVMGADDPFEKSEILRDIEQGLSHENLEDRMSDAGFGGKTRTTADDILARLK
ncbi:MAG: PspA/IM30 family protein [Paracoccaceae bacterium]